MQSHNNDLIQLNNKVDKLIQKLKEKYYAESLDLLPNQVHTAPETALLKSLYLEWFELLNNKVEISLHFADRVREIGSKFTRGTTTAIVDDIANWVESHPLAYKDPLEDELIVRQFTAQDQKELAAKIQVLRDKILELMPNVLGHEVGEYVAFYNDTLSSPQLNAKFIHALREFKTTMLNAGNATRIINEIIEFIRTKMQTATVISEADANSINAVNLSVIQPKITFNQIRTTPAISSNPSSKNAKAVVNTVNLSVIQPKIIFNEIKTTPAISSNPSNKNAKAIVIEKMLKMHDLLTEGSTKEKFHLWLTVGKGKGAREGVQKFSETLKTLLEKHNAAQEYQIIINGENPNRPDGTYNWNAKRAFDSYDTKSLSAFLDKYPAVLDFLFKYIPNYLEKIYDAFNHVDQLRPSDQKEQPSAPSISQSEKYALSRTPVAVLSKEQTDALLQKSLFAAKAKNTLMLVNASGTARIPYQISNEAYTQAIKQLGIRGGEGMSNESIKVSTIKQTVENMATKKYSP